MLCYQNLIEKTLASRKYFVYPFLLRCATEFYRKLTLPVCILVVQVTQDSYDILTVALFGSGFYFVIIVGGSNNEIVFFGEEAYLSFASQCFVCAV